MKFAFHRHPPAPVWGPCPNIFIIFWKFWKNKKGFFIIFFLILSILPTKNYNKGVYLHKNSSRVPRGQAHLKTKKLEKNEDFFHFWKKLSVFRRILYYIYILLIWWGIALVDFKPVLLVLWAMQSQTVFGFKNSYSFWIWKSQLLKHNSKATSIKNDSKSYFYFLLELKKFVANRTKRRTITLDNWFFIYLCADRLLDHQNNGCAHKNMAAPI